MTLKDGMIQQIEDDGEFAPITFVSYQIDLSEIVATDTNLRLKSSDRFLHELFYPSMADRVNPAIYPGLIAEGHSRLATPLYSLALAFLALAFLIRGQFQRMGYGRRLAICALVGFGIRLGGFALISASESSPALNWTQYALPVFVIMVCLFYLMSRRPPVRGRLFRAPFKRAVDSMRVLSRYIAKQTLKGIFLAFVVICSIIMLIDFVEGSRNIGADAELNAGQVFMLTALKTPLLIEQTVPFVVLFGVMGALYGMNRRSELIVMRASGQSAWKFLAPAMILVAFIGVLWTLIANPFAVSAMAQHDSLSAQYEGKIESIENNPIWLREGTEFEQTVIYAPSFNLVRRTLDNPEFTISKAAEDGGQVFSHRFDAKKAELLTTGYWQLTETGYSSLTKRSLFRH